MNVLRTYDEVFIMIDWILYIILICCLIYLNFVYFS